MKRFSAMAISTAFLLALAACGGGSPQGDATGTDAGQDQAPPQDDGPPPGDAEDAADGRPDLPPQDAPDAAEDDGGYDLAQRDLFGGDEGVEPADDGLEPDDAAADEGPADTCTGPACVPCEDDGLICTDEARDPESGECVPVLKPDFCLVDGACYFTLQPSPDNPCTFCVPATATDAFTPSAGLPCDDGDPCTSGEACDATGACGGGGPTDCDDDNPCTKDRCEPRVGCVQTNYDSTCDDRDACTYLDRCQNRVCTGTPVNCNDNNPCTNDSCDPALGCLNVPNANPCDDLNACTEGDTCTDRVCLGTPVDCDDGDPCTVDSCAEGPFGGCRHQTMGGMSCDDGNACTTNDYCSRPNPSLPAVCVGYDRTCDDGNFCTDDACDPAVGCTYVPNAVACVEDGDPCTTDERCREGKCVGVPVDMDDGNACTLDTCDPIYGIRHTPTSGACDDGNACTTGENCSTGRCEAPDQPGFRTDCNDRNDCTVDDCLPATGCLHTPRSGACADSDPCSLTGYGTCKAGVCVGVVKDCDDGNSCTVDSCDAAGNCIHAPAGVGAACDDNNPCTSGEACQADGDCAGGGATNCDDGNVCTIDACRLGFGCVYTPTPGYCDDRSACTVNDQCNDGVCAGTPIACEDYNYCTENTCEAAVGCVFVPNDKPCDDQNPCTVDDQCVAAACVGESLFTDPSLKAGKLSIGLSGNPGQGVDLDGKETTCAPKGNCVQGIDNAFGVLSWLFNPEITKVVATGDLALLLEPDGPIGGGAVFPLRYYWGERIAPAACDPATPGCNYGVYPDNLQGVCEPVHGFDNAKVEGNRLTAGGAAYEVPAWLVFGLRRIPLTLRWAKVSALVSVTEGVMKSGVGALGGLVTVQEVRDGIAAIPGNEFPPPYTRDIVLQYIDLYLKPDFDRDGDGVKESVSMGWPVTLVNGTIVGPL